ncbi:unnamed protein product, partial [Rotaria sordida]
AATAGSTTAGEVKTTSEVEESTQGTTREVVETTVEGNTLSPIRGNPTSLPNDKFPTELVAKIVIEILETTDNHSPKQVTLSVVACAPGVTVGTTEGTTREVVETTGETAPTVLTTG